MKMDGAALGRLGLAALFLTAGVLHFVRGDIFAQVVPPYLPYPLALVYISGFFELLGGCGILLQPTRRLAGYGLIALLIAVFPANIQMALDPIAVAGWTIPPLLLWIRLPLQIALIAAVYYCTLGAGKQPAPSP